MSSYLFDPRKNKHIKTNNPIIIMADILLKGGVKPNAHFWNNITNLADYADKNVKNWKKKSGQVIG